MTNLFDGIDQETRDALEEAVEYHPELAVFLENPNASVEALENLTAKRKRQIRRKDKADGN
jgi:hypothetical protein